MKKNNSWIYLLSVLGMVLMFSGSCTKKDDSTPAPPTATVTDADGNVYHLITIGKQVWMAENLKTTRYRDGTSIPLAAGNSAWSNLTTPGYCWYNYDTTYKSTYGALYNWYAVNTGKLAPAGWHIPADSEWTTLVNFLGGESAAGGKLKEPATTHWNSPNTGATNKSGFTAVPGGCRDSYGTFYYMGDFCYLWSATPFNSGNALYRRMYYNYGNIFTYNWGKGNGFSVRCIKD